MVQSHNTMQSMKNEAKQCTKTSRSIIKFKKKSELQNILISSVLLAERTQNKNDSSVCSGSEISGRGIRQGGLLFPIYPSVLSTAVG